jgi:secreted trypsin-like serine protease
MIECCYDLKVDATGSVRIVSGQDAPRTRYPYIVSLRSATTGRHACGGSLIASDIVLTAAHCDSSDRVWIGAYSQNDVLAGQEEIEIQQQIQHPLRQTINEKDHGKFGLHPYIVYLARLAYKR